MARGDDRIEIENVNTPGVVTCVDRAKYSVMRTALLEVMPEGAPGISAAEAKERLLPLLPADLFPHGEKARWWAKTVQLDLEAKGLLQRARTNPLTFYRPQGRHEKRHSARRSASLDSSVSPPAAGLDFRLCRQSVFQERRNRSLGPRFLPCRTPQGKGSSDRKVE